MSEKTKPLAGLLWLRAGGHDFSLPLAGVRRVALLSQLRVARSGRGGPSWWGGAALDDGRSHPLLHLGELIDATNGAWAGTDAVVVMVSLWQFRVGLLCERFRGIIPAGGTSWALPSRLFASGGQAFPRARLCAGRPVVDLVPEHLFSGSRRTQFDQVMKNSHENVDQLWELSELEQQLAAAPTAKGYRDLASRYKKLGWLEEAERMHARAAKVKAEAPVVPPAAAGLSGPFNGRVLVELLQVLHITGKSGELVLDAPGAIAGVITFSQGRIVDAKSGDAENELLALRQLCSIQAGRYQFLPGEAADGESRLIGDTAEVIATLARPAAVSS
ncbi:MAG: DUF4388 domain-containing protein [Verrucomicrobia bacterium]|nr:DUF4388 domain-containing protein [Verrucomicrobiota bacterium]